MSAGAAGRGRRRSPSGGWADPSPSAARPLLIAMERGSCGGVGRARAPPQPLPIAMERGFRCGVVGNHRAFSIHQIVGRVSLASQRAPLSAATGRGWGRGHFGCGVVGNHQKFSMQQIVPQLPPVPQRAPLSAGAGRATSDEAELFPNPPTPGLAPFGSNAPTPADGRTTVHRWKNTNTCSTLLARNDGRKRRGAGR